MSAKLVIVFGGCPSPELGLWLNHNQITYQLGPTGYRIDVARNKITNTFLKNPDLSHLIMINNDLYPTKYSSNIFWADDDLSYLDCCGSNGSSGCRTFNTACASYSRTLLTSIPAPHFQLTTDDQYTEITCDCANFEAKARSCGFIPRMVGSIGHITRAVFLPDGENNFKLTLLPVANCLSN